MKKRVTAKTLAARAKSDKFLLPQGPDNAAARYFSGGPVVNKRTEHMATGPCINVMAQPVYTPGDGETAVRRVVPGAVANCVCGCGHRPGCTGFLAIASVGEAD
jgi:hypothetical protein